MSKQPGPCCGTSRTWFGSMLVAWRGKPKVKKAGRKVFHVIDGDHEIDHDPLVIQPPFNCEFCSMTHDGDCPDDKIFWHWWDQRLKLVEGYGPAEETVIA